MAKNQKRLLAQIKRAVETHDPEKIESLSDRLAKQLEEPPTVESKNIAGSLIAAIDSNDSKRVLAISRLFVEELRTNPVEYPKAFVAALKDATESFDRTRVAELCSQLITQLQAAANPYPLDQAKALLGLLRRKRYFNEIIIIADALIQSGQTDAKIRRQYAQALLDLGQLTAGLSVLLELEHDCVKKKNKGELAEARGLIGRAHKQIYMDAAKGGRPGQAIRQHLSESIISYHRVYNDDETKVWQGINAVALISRAKKDRVGLGKPPLNSSKAAKRVLDHIARKKNKAEHWDLATAAEACLALGNHRSALNWIVKYCSAKEADAFEFASTLRQFEEVWCLDSSNPNHAKILQLLRSALLARQGGSIQISDAATETAAASKLANSKQYEKVLGDDRYKTFVWYAKGIDRARAVAKITDKSGNGLGTGFLLPGSKVHKSIKEKWVLVTNTHVISDDPSEQRLNPRSIAPDEARVVFEAGDNAGIEYQIENLIYTSPRNNLDCTIVSLSGSPKLDKPIEVAKRLPVVGKRQRVYVIGHPRGGGLSFSIDDNLLLDHEVPKIHYRAPTEGGSSGSPVFNPNWDLIALHHAGGIEMNKLNDKPGVYPANEGITIQAILTAIAHELG